MDWPVLGEVLVRLLERSHGLEPIDIQRVVAEEAARAGVDDFEIFLVDRQQHNLSSLLSGEKVAVDGTLMGDAFRRGRVHATEAGERIRLAVPLVDGADRLGTVAAVVDTGDDETIRGAHALAAITAEILVSKAAYSDVIDAVQNSREMDLAATLRWSFLPPLTMRTPRVSIAGMLEPAYDIAGDAFDYAVNGDVAHLGVIDAVGHGLRSAQLANLTIGAYRWCRRRGESLAGTCAAIDETLRDQFGESWFVTAIFAELDLRDGMFHWVNAGHPRPLLLRSGKVVGELTSKPAAPLGLEAPGPPLGEQQLEPGDLVVLYSDGVTEARTPDGDFFGEERLVDYIERAAASELSPAETLRRLVVTILDFQAGPLRDDATLLLAGWRPDRNA